MAKNTTAKSKNTTETVTEEMFRSEVAALGLSKSEIKTAEIMGGGSWDAALAAAKNAAIFKAAKKNVAKEISDNRGEASKEVKARIAALWKLAFPKSKESAPDCIFNIRDEERFSGPKDAKVLANRLVGIRFEVDDIAHCLQAVVPVTRKRGGLSKTSEEVEKDVDAALVNIIKVIATTVNGKAWA